MRGWLRLAARLYPKSWRDRYGREFEALLDGVVPVWSDLFDVLRGAAMMQVRTMSSYLKLAGAVTLAAVVVAAVAAFMTPGPYVSSSVVRVSTAPDERSADLRLPDRLNMAWQVITSQSSLSETIQRSSLDLYEKERHREPLLYVIEEMKTKLRIERIEREPRYRISFTYPDKRKAKDTVDALTLKLRLNLSQGAVQVVSGATLPDVPLAPDRFRILAWGLAIGLTAGVLAASLRWRWTWTLKVIAFGVVGFFAVGYLVFNGWLPVRYTSHAKVVILPLPSEIGHLMASPELRAWLDENQARVLSDESLREIIEWPPLNLYPKERAILPLSAMAAKMRKDLAIELLNSQSALRITFTYPDRFTAQRVVSAVVAKLDPEPMLRYRALVGASKSTHWSKDATVLGCSSGPG